ncbi:tripartite tricarboxylate transporter substrate-binding protein [Cupriavidus basilensis]|uniref:Tripartite tricarboxylate transporter substrate-binding protein n=1 Tax=Cupriavidus basilensis TaxID=68895 RepID=A0ABT6ANJ3_9BURK|nr:tripartite tricarboxylate transporter substrate-binding protein [Cupriavidus basilensis]MDF3834195.1 tripartite tricarboxylate transporter substrate-binding protein [Cupriavidus basilensis]
MRVSPSTCVCTARSKQLASPPPAPAVRTHLAPGQGSLHHLATELLKQNEGIFMAHVPYRVAPGVYQGLLTGDIQGMFETLSGPLPFIESGRSGPWPSPAPTV